MNCWKQKYLTEGTIIPAKSLNNGALIAKKREFFCRTSVDFAIWLFISSFAIPIRPDHQGRLIDPLNESGLRNHDLENIVNNFHVITGLSWRTEKRYDKIKYFC